MKFKTRDHVRVIDRTSKYFDQVGEVWEIHGNSSGITFGVVGVEPYAVVHFGHDDLILADSEPHAADSVNSYAGTYSELEDLARQIVAYQSYVDAAEKRRADAIEKESRNIEMELKRVRECEARLRVLVREMGLASGTPGHAPAVQEGA